MLQYLHTKEQYKMKKVSLLGPKGTFSDLACQKYMKNIQTEIIYASSIESSVEALNHADYAIVPIENTLDGYVQQTLDLLLDKIVYIIDEIYVPVQFSLIAHVNHTTEIKRVYTQFVAKGQCYKFLKELSTDRLIITESNMESFNLVKHGIEGDAAIVPSHMVHHFNGFKITDVTDTKENFTRFFILSKQLQHIEANETKVSIVVNPIIDRPGLLFDILGIFKKYNINLTSIMSRPTKTEMGNYLFYIEMKSNSLNKSKIDQALTEIQNDFKIKILGVYPARS